MHSAVEAAVNREIAYSQRPSGPLTSSIYTYGGGTYDGRRYVYLAPGQAGNGPLVRLDTWGDFRAPTSWEAVELHLQHPWLNSASTKWSLFGGIVSDGRYLYMAPNDYGSRYGE